MSMICGSISEQGRELYSVKEPVVEASSSGEYLTNLGKKKWKEEEQFPVFTSSFIGCCSIFRPGGGGEGVGG
jgi:hypothetical protein